MSYPTQEDELRAKEAQADGAARLEQSNFIASFQQIPKKNGARLQQLSQSIVSEFNQTMEAARLEPYERQENLMAGLRKLLQEEANVIQAKKEFAAKIGAAKQEP